MTPSREICSSTISFLIRYHPRSSAPSISLTCVAPDLILNWVAHVFEIIGDITDIETIAVDSAIREIARLRQQYGSGRWRKLKGTAMIHLPSCRTRLAELHWYESHENGIWIGKHEHTLCDLY